jgi:hypothetical protein
MAYPLSIVARFGDFRSEAEIKLKTLRCGHYGAVPAGSSPDPESVVRRAHQRSVPAPLPWGFFASVAPSQVES